MQKIDPEITLETENNTRTTVFHRKSDDAIGIGDIIYYGSNDDDTNKCHNMSHNTNGTKDGVAELDIFSSLFDGSNKGDGIANGNPFQNNKATQSKNTYRADESLAGIMKDLNLYEELYEFMKSKEITPEALMYMQSRHIDELFNGSRLSLKIIFEHRLDEWQKKRKQNNEEEVSMNISHKSCQEEKCQLFTIKHSNGTSSSYHLLGSTDLTSLSNRFMEVIQNSLSAVLMEFKTSTDSHHSNCINESGNSNGLKTLATVSLAPHVIHTEDQNQLTENLNIISMEAVAPEIQLPSVTVLQEPELIVPSSGDTTEPLEPDLTIESLSDEIITENQSEDQTPTTNKPSNHIINSNMLELSVSHTTKRKWGIETDLREILLMYKPGNYILKYYKTYGVLTAKLRSDLVHIIVDHFVLNNEFVSVTRCRILAEEIAELFPTECVETYFSQENRRLTPKGKLWNLYQNQRRLQKKESYTTYPKSNRLKMESICVHLKNITDENYLLKKWNKTFHYRRYQLQSHYFSNWKLFFDEYPFCKQQHYCLFIDADLATLYPDLAFDDHLWDDFMNNFQIFFWNRIKHKESKQLFDELSSMDVISTPSDYFPIKIIQLLHAVLNNTPCLEEAQRQFTVEVTDLIELKEIVIDRKKYCLENDIQCKPYIAVVRENNTYVHYSVILDSTGFGCDNYKESLILCFKLYLFFDICYPKESFSVWLFIQRYFFNKQSLIVDATVDAFINDVRSQSKVNLEVTS